MANPTLQSDSDGTVSLRSAVPYLRALYENGIGVDVELFGTAAADEDPDSIQPVRAHKLILMHASKHLHELFTVDGYLDSHQKQYKLTEISHESLSDILKFVYTDELNFPADCASERIQKVLIGAKFLVMLDLANVCEAYLASDKHLNLQNCMCMVRFARKYTCLSLLDTGLSLAARNLLHFIDDLNFLSLSEKEVTKLLLSEPIITLADADQRCRAAIAWLNHDRSARDACVCDILNTVPFDLNTISLDTIAAVGNNEAIRASFAEKFTNTVFDGVLKNYERDCDQRHCAKPRAVSDLWWNADSSRDMWYLMGGEDAMTECVVYDVKRRYWSKLRDLPWTRKYAGACIMSNTIFVFGGRKNGQISADIDQLNLSTLEWTTSSTKLSAGRTCVTGRCAYNKQSAFVVGGCTGDVQNFVGKVRVSSKDGDGTFAINLDVMPKMCVDRIYASAVCVGDSSVFVAGGYRNDLRHKVSSIEKYDSIASKWSIVGDMKCGGRSSSMAAVLGDDLYLAGGWNADSKVADYVEIFNIRTGQIRQAPNMLGNRSNGSGVALDRNTFCVVGGLTNEDRADLRTVECYDVREGKWSTGSIVPDMPTANSGFSFANCL